MRLTGIPFGSTTTELDAAFDGKPSTRFNASIGSHVGIDVLLSASGAPELVTPVSISQTRGDTLSQYGYAATRMIDGSGLDDTPTLANFATVFHGISGLTDGSNVLWSSGTSYSSGPFDDPDTPRPRFELDLGNKYGLSALVVWGDPRENRNEATDFTLEFSTNGGQSWGNSVQVATGRLLGEASAKMDFPGGFVEANRVRLTVTGNAASKGYAPGQPGGDRVVVGELRFVGRLLPSDATGQILKGVRLYPSALGVRENRSTFDNRDNALFGAVIEGSHGGTYTVLHTISGQPKLDWSRHPVSNDTAYRYYRMRGDASNRAAFEIAELEFWMALRNVARGRISTATSTAAGYPALHLTDGDLATSWRSDPGAAGEQRVVVDLGGERTFSRIRIVWGDAPAPADTYRIHTSSDGSAWTRRNVVSGGVGETETLSYDDELIARYVRLTAQQNAGESFEIRELRVQSRHAAPAAPTLSARGELDGLSLDGARVTLTLAHVAFESAVMASHVGVRGPPGIGATSVTRDSDTQLTVTLSYSGERFATVEALTFSVEPDAVSNHSTRLTVSLQTVSTPTLTITSPASFPTSAAFGVTLSFSEQIQGLPFFAAEVVNGTASRLSALVFSYRLHLCGDARCEPCR